MPSLLQLPMRRERQQLYQTCRYSPIKHVQGITLHLANSVRVKVIEKAPHRQLLLGRSRAAQPKPLAELVPGIVQNLVGLVTATGIVIVEKVAPPSATSAAPRRQGVACAPVATSAAVVTVTVASVFSAEKKG